jgi:hypothetical protein
MAMSAFGVEDPRISKSSKKTERALGYGAAATGGAYVGAIVPAARAIMAADRKQHLGDWVAYPPHRNPTVKEAARAGEHYAAAGELYTRAHKFARVARPLGIATGVLGVGAVGANLHRKRAEQVESHRSNMRYMGKSSDFGKGLRDHRGMLGLGAITGLGGGITTGRMAAGARDRSAMASGLGHSMINQAPGARAPTGDALIQGAKHFDEAGALAGKATKLTRVSRGGLIGAGVLGAGALLSRNKQPQPQY